MGPRDGGLRQGRQGGRAQAHRPEAGRGRPQGDDGGPRGEAGGAQAGARQDCRARGQLQEGKRREGVAGQPGRQLREEAGARGQADLGPRRGEDAVDRERQDAGGGVYKRHGRRARVERHCCLPGRLLLDLPRRLCHRGGQGRQDQGHPRERHGAAGEGAGQPRADPRLEPPGPAEGHALDRQRHHHEQEQAVAAHDRPPGPGQQVDPQHGEGQPAGRLQALAERLHPQPRDVRAVRPPGAARERGRDHRLHPRAPPHQGGVQERGEQRHQHWRQRRRVPRRLQALPHHQAPQPPLRP
mmetsp:Transcript_31426/g.79716  ORF Transcript_31426/g.79716 Transcript_31426/m.79716 type:complete len:298 (-) Transcript_31426:851-1744(-)